jgi:hypothetical protein
MYAKHCIFVFLALGIVISSTLRAEDLVAARAIVTANDVEKLRAFDEALKSAARTSLDKLLIHCNDCADLSRSSTRVTYTFFRDNPALPMLFWKAWAKMQSGASALDPDFKLQFDVDVPSPDCSGMPAPCTSAPFCPTGCDKVRGAPCTLCQ